MSDDPVMFCDACGGEVARVMFAPAIHFKGSGFHNTDYGTKRRPVGGDGNGDGNGDGAPAKAADGVPAGGTNGAGAPVESASASSTTTVGLDTV
jgi:hypothetical protein